MFLTKQPTESQEELTAVSNDIPSTWVYNDALYLNGTSDFSSPNDDNKDDDDSIKSTETGTDNSNLSLESIVGNGHWTLESQSALNLLPKQTAECAFTLRGNDFTERKLKSWSHCHYFQVCTYCMYYKKKSEMQHV